VYVTEVGIVGLGWLVVDGTLCGAAPYSLRSNIGHAASVGARPATSAIVGVQGIACPKPGEVVTPGVQLPKQLPAEPGTDTNRTKTNRRCIAEVPSLEGYWLWAA
jgi:hypothetical protein